MTRKRDRAFEDTCIAGMLILSFLFLFASFTFDGKVSTISIITAIGFWIVGAWLREDQRDKDFVEHLNETRTFTKGETNERCD